MKLIAHTLAATAVFVFSAAATANEVAVSSAIEKFQTTGKVVMGVRENAAPMSFALGANTEFVGYHTELCERVIRDIAPKAKIVPMVLTAQNTMPLIQNGTADFNCASMTNNLARQNQVAFGLTTYVSEVRMAVRADSGITSFEQLDGRKVVATAGTTAVQLLRKYSRDKNAKIDTLFGKDHFESLLQLESGRVDAFVLDDNLLAGVIASGKNPQNYRIVGEVLGAEPIAIQFRKDDPVLKKAVDDSIRRMMKNGDLARLYKKWFMSPIPPKNISLNLPMGETLKKLITEPNDRPLEWYTEGK